MSTQSTFAEVHQYAAILQSIDVGLLVVDMDFNITLWNGFMENHSGIEPEQALGHNLFSLFDELDQTWFTQKVEQLKIIKNQAFTTWEQRPYLLKFPNYRPITGNANFMYQNATFIPLISTEGEVDSVCVIIYDVTNAAINKLALEDASEQLFVFETIDPHTWFNDDSWWSELINYEYQRYQRTEEDMTIVIFQIDTGTVLPEDDMMDQFMGQVVDKLAKQLRLTDKFARIDGHQIAALLVSTELEKAKPFIERVTESFNEHVLDWKGKKIQFHCDAGWAQLNKDDESEMAWEQRAKGMLPNLFE